MNTSDHHAEQDVPLLRLKSDSTMHSSATSDSEDAPFDPNHLLFEYPMHSTPTASPPHFTSLQQEGVSGFEEASVNESDSDVEATPSLLMERSFHRTKAPLLHRPIHKRQPNYPIRTSLIADPETLRKEWKKNAVNYFLQTPNMDAFCCDLYAYYSGKGYSCLLATRFTHILTIAFLISFSTFLFGCLEYRLLHFKKHLYEIIIPQCHAQFPWFIQVGLWIFWVWWMVQLGWILFEMNALQKMKLFYNHGLNISEMELKTISWREIVNRLLLMRDEAKQQTRLPRVLLNLNAHTIAQRIMRQDNYWIALFNKDILDLRMPWIGKRHLFTKIMEWNLELSVMSFVFEPNGQIKSFILNNPAECVKQLRLRFFLIGLLNFLFMPIVILLLILYFFFRYAEELHKNPSLLSKRQYTRIAHWTFREFNELHHVFMQRLHQSHRRASFYMEQFPNYAWIILSKFFAFIFGSFVAVLALIAFIDQDLLLNFELTPGLTALFYIGVFGGLFAMFSSFIPEEHQLYDPETILKKVVQDIHYLPDHWRGRLHTEEVKQQFGLLFEYRWVLLCQELLSVLSAPFVCWFSLMHCAPELILFFKEFSVQVDDLGYVCSFSLFDFKKHGNLHYNPVGTTHPHQTTKNGKMEQSFVHFKYHHPEWEPEFMEGSQYLSFLLSRMPLQQSKLFTQGAPLNHSVFQDKDAQVEGSGEHEQDLFGLVASVYEERRDVV